MLSMMLSIVLYPGLSCVAAAVSMRLDRLASAADVVSSLAERLAPSVLGLIAVCPSFNPLAVAYTFDRSCCRDSTCKSLDRSFLLPT